MEQNLSNQTIALAGLTQAVYLVRQIARNGNADRQDMQVSIASTLKIDADDILDVYGGLSGLKTGLQQLEKQLSEPRHVDPEMARYASTLIFLDQILLKQPPMLDVIGVAIQRASQAAEKTGQVLDEEVFDALSYGYQQSLSLLKPRVIISGEEKYLSDAWNASRIRALLLAGIRSAVLWRQAGGARWKLLFVRARIQREAKRLLATL